MLTKQSIIMASGLLFFSNIFSAFPRITIGKNVFPVDVLDKIHKAGSNSYSTLAALYNSFEIAAFCIQNNIPGDFVECGVAVGAQVAAMALAGQIIGAPRIIHLFDSFEGIPLAGPNDDQQPGIVGPIKHNTQVTNLNELLVSSGITVHSLENVKAYMQSCKIDQSYLRYHKGWFQYVLPEVAPTIGQIACLRLDGDLYESTKVSLEYLYPKVIKGGFVIIDDYALTGCRKAVDEYLKKNNLCVNIITIEGGYGSIYWRVE